MPGTRTIGDFEIYYRRKGARSKRANRRHSTKHKNDAGRSSWAAQTRQASLDATPRKQKRRRP